MIEDGDGVPIGIGRVARTIPGWLRRLLIQRDGGCTFPGCAATRYLDGHHVKWWIDGGLTDLDNLTLTCGFHHRLVHEESWTVRLDDHHRAQWFRPDGTRYEAGIVTTRGPTRSPPAERVRREETSEAPVRMTGVTGSEGEGDSRDESGSGDPGSLEPLELTLFVPTEAFGRDADVAYEEPVAFAGAAF